MKHVVTNECRSAYQGEGTVLVHLLEFPIRYPSSERTCQVFTLIWLRYAEQILAVSDL